MDVPGISLVCPSVLVMATSASGVRVVVSVALLLPELGSATPVPAITEAVLLSVPVAEAKMVALTVKVTEPPTGRLTIWLRLPEPEAVQEAPPLAEHVQVTAVRAAGKVSETSAAGALLGPSLEATMV